MRLKGGLLLAGAIALAACSRGGPLEGMRPRPPVVAQQTFSAVEGSLKVVGVMPFSPHPDLRFKLGSAQAAEEIAEIVSNFYTDSLVSQGVRVVAPSDLTSSSASRACPPKRFVTAAARLIAVS